jgi:uncharacterized protein YbaR (Trm112 family)
MQEYLRELLCCPACHGKLAWSIEEMKAGHIEEGTSTCDDCGEAYPIREGIGVFLTAEHAREDLWQEVESNLMRYVRKDPQLYSALMSPPIESLNPADQFFRAMVLEEQGDFAVSEKAEALALQGMYTPAYSDCWADQVDFLVRTIRDTKTPVVDIASGRGYLVQVLAKSIDAPIVASDFSLQVMRRNRRWFEYWHLYHRVSLLVFDARQMPFTARSIGTMTTNLGLPNIREGGKLFGELRRVVSGRFLGISHFFSEDDPNAMAIKKAGLADMLYEKRLVSGLSSAGFAVEFLSRARNRAEPTPIGEIIEGAQVDGLPVAEADLDWCVIESC